MTPADLDVVTAAPGPKGSLPITPADLLQKPSGDLFGWTQDVGMGWRPEELGRPEVLILSTQGGIRRPDGIGARARLPHGPLGGGPADGGRRPRAARARAHAVRRLRHRSLRRPHAGHDGDDGQPGRTATTPRWCCGG